MTQSPSRRWFQLSLKSLFLLVLLVATFFAGYAMSARLAEEAIQAERDARLRAQEAARQAELTRQQERRLRVRAEFESGVDGRLQVGEVP
jgi:hypothetical protein